VLGAAALIFGDVGKTMGNVPIPSLGGLTSLFGKLDCHCGNIDCGCLAPIGHFCQATCGNLCAPVFGCIKTICSPCSAICGPVCKSVWGICGGICSPLGSVANAIVQGCRGGCGSIFGDCEHICQCCVAATRVGGGSCINACSGCIQHLAHCDVDKITGLCSICGSLCKCLVANAKDLIGLIPGCK